MKKIMLSVILMMTVCVCGMQAQRMNDSTSVVPSIPQPKTDNMEQTEILLQKFAKLLEENTGQDKPILVPLGKKNPKWFAAQRIGFSIFGGSDGDASDAEPSSPLFKQEELSDEKDENDSKFNGGFAGEYTFSFIPGHRAEDGSIKINPFGFAINTGLVFSFDKQDYYGVTCDLLAKVGFETGLGHKSGFGVDFLFGGGKSCGAYYHLFDTDNDGSVADEPITGEPYTAWCPKLGGEVYFRAGLLTGNKNAKLFARFIHSNNPNKLSDAKAVATQTTWFADSWHVGLTYFF